MRLTWYAHASFRIEDNGFSLVTDPYEPSYLNLLPIQEQADVVVLSSLADRAHSYWQGVPGDPVIVNALDYAGTETTLPNGTRLVSIEAMEASLGRPEGDIAKPTAMYLFELGGVRIAHMGDVGDQLSEEQLAPLRGAVDVLLAPVGNLLTIPLEALDEAIRQIGPAMIVPMHFFTPRINYPFGHVDAFLDRHAAEPIVTVDGSSFEVMPDLLPEERTIVVLKALNG